MRGADYLVVWLLSGCVYVRVWVCELDGWNVDVVGLLMLVW